MNPRDFCQEEGYGSTLCLTYSFDPIFFERIVLPDLWKGGSTDIVVLGDRKQLSEATARCQNQLGYVGRKFVLATAAIQGSFHPKLILRLGEDGARLWVGSGNLTNGGWVGNDELASEWNLTRDSASAAVVRDLIELVRSYARGQLIDESLSRFRDHEWLAGSDIAQAPDRAVLLTRPQRSLFDELRERWSGRRFQSLHVLTGSTDTSGAFLRACAEAFGIEEFVVCGNPHRLTFNPGELKDFPGELQLAFWTDESLMHAKFYWFDGADGAAAVSGSANCSKAAWLLAPNLGGNVEALVVYDNASKDDFWEIIGRIPTVRTPIKELPQRPEGTDDSQKTQHPEFQLVEFYVDEDSGKVVAILNREVPAAARVDLLFDADRYRLRRAGGAPKRFLGPLPEFGAASVTIFGVVEVALGDNVWRTAPRWLDELARIRTATRDRNIVRTLQGLARRPAKTRDQDRIIADLTMIANSLFDDISRSTPRRGKQKKRNGQEEAEGVASPVNPGELVRELADLINAAPSTSSFASPVATLSLSGIMRILFDLHDEVDALKEEAATGSEPEEGNGESRPPEPNQTTPKPPDEKEARRTPPAILKKIRRLLDDCLVKIGEEKFASRCSARQMVEAAALPLAILSVGSEAKWFDEKLSGEARTVLSRLNDVLFRKPFGTSKTPGLIRYFRQRYAEDRRADTFDDVIGDGTLWVVLAAAISRVQWEGYVAWVERAVILRDLSCCQELTSRCDAPRLGLLLSRFPIEQLLNFVTHETSRVVDTLKRIEAHLRPKFHKSLRAQRGQEHQKGNLVWRPKFGWSTVVEGAPIDKDGIMRIRSHSKADEIRVKAKGYHLNLTLENERNSELRNLLAQLEPVGGHRDSKEF